MKRLYESLIRTHFRENRQMLFLMGPRQVGKTTASLSFSSRHGIYYFNWDNEDERLTILDGPKAVTKFIDLDKLSRVKPIVIFDEIHKYSRWKNFLKGFYDSYGDLCEIVVTGSARLNVFRRGGDSLMGRYFLYCLHPFSVREIIDCSIRKREIVSPKPINERSWKTLIEYGGFPEPFVRNSKRFYNRWQKLRHEQLFYEDLRDITRIHDISQVELLAELMRHQVGQLVSLNSLAKKVRVTAETIRRWTEILKAVYYCFEVRPWSKNITRSLLKEPKLYLYDWSLVEDKGARCENMVASHLLKAVHFWTDHGFGLYDLYFIRDKEKREVDFLVTKDGKPWFLVEVKSSSSRSLSPDLVRFQKQIEAPFAFQVAFDMPYLQQSCFLAKRPVIVPAQTFLSQLV